MSSKIVSYFNVELALSPEMGTLKWTALVPEPRDTCWVDIELESPLLVPYSNQAVVADPFGLTFPFKFALLLARESSIVVVTIGRLCCVTVTVTLACWLPLL